MLNLTKPSYTTYGSRKLCRLVSRHEIFGDITSVTTKSEEGINHFSTEIRNRLGKRLGYEIFSLEEGNKNIFGYNINVIPEYRNKNLRIGEILRLSSIIEMFENNAPAIDIYSKDTAIYFHSKYKFRPAIMAFNERDKALESIIRNALEGFEEFRAKAFDFIQRIKENPDAASQRQLRDECNPFIYEYIQKVLQTTDAYKHHKFNFGMGMRLTAEDVKANKTFFNALYKKHGIDYEVK